MLLWRRGIVKCVAILRRARGIARRIVVRVRRRSGSVSYVTRRGIPWLRSVGKVTHMSRKRAGLLRVIGGRGGITRVAWRRRRIVLFWPWRKASYVFGKAVIL